MDFFNRDYKIIFNVFSSFVDIFELYNDKIKAMSMRKYQNNSALSNCLAVDVG